MAHDAHCHPDNLAAVFPSGEMERRLLAVPCAASSWNQGEFERQERLSRESPQDAPMFLTFAVHPQACAGDAWRESLAFLEKCAGRIDGVGETGFDLYSEEYKSREALQEELFCAHLEFALRHGLPVTLHIRRAMHKVFAHEKALRRLPACIFHSYSGVLEEAAAILKKGINAYFSFGNALLNNHKKALRAAAALPAERLLFETDAPFQPPPGEEHSSCGNLAGLRTLLAGLRGMDASSLERLTDANFHSIYGKSPASSRITCC